MSKNFSSAENLDVKVFPIIIERKLVYNKNFPYQTVPEMNDSCIKKSGEVEYDNQNCLGCHKNV